MNFLGNPSTIKNSDEARNFHGEEIPKMVLIILIDSVL